MVTDPIADLLTQIRNASRVGYPTAKTPFSKAKERILKVLLEQGYVYKFEAVKNEDGKQELKIYLRYTAQGKPAVKEIKRMSRPGRRMYVPMEDIPRCKGGLGTVIVSTSQGMMSDRQAREKGVGGELVCSVF